MFGIQLLQSISDGPDLGHSVTSYYYPHSINHFSQPTYLGGVVGLEAWNGFIWFYVVLYEFIQFYKCFTRVYMGLYGFYNGFYGFIGGLYGFRMVL